MFKFVGIIFCGAMFFLAGCATPPSEPVPMEWSVTNAVAKPAVARTNRPPGSVLPVKPSPARRPPIVQPPVLTWTSLNRWAAEHKLGQPQRLASSPMAVYSISSAHGVMTLAIGSLTAAWNGREIYLGFDPEMIDGEIFLHGLDLQKNLEPLLCDEPLTFANHIIVIDPGHGGKNSGTISVLDQRPEKEFTLDLAKRIKPLLEQAGWKVLLTRTNDYDVSLSNRVAFAEAQHADLFISLHFNSAAPDKKQNGLETYCLTPTGMPSTLTRGFADPLPENLPNNDFDAQNLQLAIRLHTALLRTSGEADRGVRRARFIGVLRGQKRPAILIEAGYLSNPSEATKIEDPEFRQKLAETIAAALAQNPESRIQNPEIATPQTHTNAISQ